MTTTEKTAEWVAVLCVVSPAPGGDQFTRLACIGEPTTYAKAWEVATQALQSMPNAVTATVASYHNA